MTLADGRIDRLEGPVADLIFLDLARDGNCVACRPSGTEPTIKFYLFSYAPPESIQNMGVCKGELTEWLDVVEKEIRDYSGIGDGV
jgi:phosphoglucomutase/phosphomannomutase